jgi:hypothetical protein
MSCGINTENVRKCLVSAFFTNAASLQPDGSYKTLLENKVVYIHPTSALMSKKIPCILYNELVSMYRLVMFTSSRSLQLSSICATLALLTSIGLLS